MFSLNWEQKHQNSSEKSETPMVYDTFAFFFRNGSILQYVFAKDVRNYQNCSEIYKIDPFIGELPNENLACQNLVRASPGLANRIS